MKLLFVTSRTISLELESETPYFAEAPFSIFLNGNLYCEESRNVFTLYNLTPDTLYKIEVLGKCVKIRTLKESMCLNVKDFNAVGDGKSDDTAKIQAAIACADLGGCVYFPKGTYLISAIFLKSNIMLYLEKDAKIIAKYDRASFPILPSEFGTWEGSLASNFASSITAIRCENIKIVGEGEIDEQAELGDWYLNHREKRMAWRGFGMYFKECRNVFVVGIFIHNTPSWNIHPFFSSQLKFINMRIENPINMPTTDGIDLDCCEDALIAGCSFSVGDDCIAIKSGTLELARKYRRSSHHIVIRNNYMNEGHGGVVFGSEASGGITDVTITKCIFKNTDRGLRIKTRRGRGRIGKIDNIHFSNIFMDGVLTPFVINMFYNMGPAGGHEEYVWTMKKLLIDDRTPILGKFSFSDIECKNISYSAGVFLGLPEEPIGGLTFKNVSFHFNKNALEGYPVMIEHKRKMLRAGLYCLNVENVVLDNVTFDGVIGDRIILKRSEEEEVC